jgi:hypothetical protein
MRFVPLLLVALTAGCAGSGETPEPGDGTTVPDDLAASVEVKVAPSTVRLVLHVTNSGADPIEFTFPTSQRFDFEVLTVDGQRVWRWSDDMAFLQAISRATLAPGESWDMEGEWDPGAREGRYVARGRLTARGRELVQQTPFDLP